MVGDTVLVGFDNPAGMGRTLQELVDSERRTEKRLTASPLGELSASRLGLPLFTLILGLLDGFNPCAMWVLLFLLSLLVHWRDRRRMALVAGTFVFVSGAVYYAFLAALALGIGGVNLRDAWRAEGRFTLSIPEQAKPGLYARMRRVLQSQAIAPALVGVALLAVVVNLVELLCTAGLPGALHGAVWGPVGNHRLTDRAGRRLKGLSGGSCWRSDCCCSCGPGG